jgi:restriction system protein
MVRAGRYGQGESSALSEGFVGIGFPEVGDLTSLTSVEALRIRTIASNPDAKPSTIANWVGQLDAFRSRIQIGDLVALPLKSAPAVAFGRITGNYRYEPQAIDEIRHQRSVSWISDGIPRDRIDQDLLYSLGSVLTVCRISRNDAERRILTLLKSPQLSLSAESTTVASQVVEPDDLANIAVDLAEIGRNQIRGRLAQRFTGHELSRLVGELLKAEGFVCDVSPAGPDGGVDVLAGEGGMGFDGATMAVQVKSGSIVADAPTLRELKGVMGNFGAQRGLLVSWGGFTKSARQEARRLFFEIRLWDSDAVIDKLLEVYGRLPADLQAEVPLQQVWTLVTENR